MEIRMKDDSNFIRTIPIEDIGYVLLENQQISISMPLLNALADNNAAVIVCTDKMMPNAMLMNLDSYSIQGERYRDQLMASEPLKKNLWKQTVEAKIRNQAALLDKLDKDGSLLKPYWQNVKSGDSDNREGVAAKAYWDALFGGDFIRFRAGDSPNEMLNYGYTVLRAAVARALMGSGLFPAFGIYHRNRYNAFPLADDVMEPYRPFVDEIVFDLYANGETELNKDVKAEILKLLYVDTFFDSIKRPLDVGLSMTTASLSKCFSGDLKKISYPLLM
jgi:CRISPR-associated protein Cas1